MTSCEWFVAENSGTLAEADDVAGHLWALERELACWEQGLRNPEQIGTLWSDRLHADRVAAQILRLQDPFAAMTRREDEF